MNKSFSFLVLVAALSACGQPVCTINGHLEDPVASVSLVDESGVVDECDVIDGTFVLKCNKNPEGVVGILRGDGYDPIGLIPDTNEMTVTVIDGKTHVSGSPLSEEYQNLQKWLVSTFMAYNERWAELNREGKREEADLVVAERKKVVSDHCLEIYGNHPSDYVGHQALSIIMEDLPENEFIALYEQGSKLIREDPAISGYYEHLKPRTQNEVFILQNNGEIDKREGRFEEFVGAGNYTLLVFWASWCGSCVKEIPYVKAVYEKYSDKGLVVLGVPVQDGQAATIAQMKKSGIYYPQLSDPSGDLFDKYGFMSIPCLILFGPDGTILKRDLRGEQIEAAVREALGL